MFIISELFTVKLDICIQREKITLTNLVSGCPLVDVRSYFLDQPRFRDLICIDGVHPSEAGYKLIFQAFTDFISNNPAAAC